MRQNIKLDLINHIEKHFQNMAMKVGDFFEIIFSKTWSVINLWKIATCCFRIVIYFFFGVYGLFRSACFRVLNIILKEINECKWSGNFNCVILFFVANMNLNNTSTLKSGKLSWWPRLSSNILSSWNADAYFRLGATIMPASRSWRNIILWIADSSRLMWMTPFPLNCSGLLLGQRRLSSN